MLTEDRAEDYLRRLTAELRQTRRLLAEAEAQHQEPIAIIGMGCRFPGAVQSPEDLWQLVVDERDVTSEFPADRGWNIDELYDPDPDALGRVCTKRGGFLCDIGEFDPSLFGVSPRDATGMDPEHRFLLEICWEAIERAGIVPASLRGSPTGVYVGLTRYDSDYLGLLQADPQRFEGRSVTGNGICMAAGRISYAFGLQGPCLGVDTACSSSLAAVHLACRALRGRECSLALAGGATIMTTPELLIELSRMRVLSSDGRCKAFSVLADGFAAGEGAGILLLERLTDAQRLGHTVLAVVRGSAVNQDGASNGLTAPSGSAQQHVVGLALADAGLTPDQIDTVEAHGTGTSLGDSIEAVALQMAYGKGRPAGQPLWIGSVKSNIAHPQAAAGVAGIIKMVQAIRHGLLPKTLHADESSPHVHWSADTVLPLTETRSWPQSNKPRRAGVSSFGMSGTNVHLILEQADPRVGAEASGQHESVRERSAFGDAVPWIMSGKSEEALREQASRLRAFAENVAGQDPWDVAAALATERSMFEHRGVVVGSGREQLLGGLGALSSGQVTADVLVGRAGSGKLAFMFCGQGSQRRGMAQELYGRFPSFAVAWDEVCADLDSHLDRPINSVVFAEPGTPEAGLLNDTIYTQSATFVLGVALFRLLQHWKAAPDYLIGHSVGELAAAHVSGVLSLEDACTMVAARGRLMQALPVGGAMVALRASHAEAAESLAGYQDVVAIAAINGPSSVVISGDEDAVLMIANGWRERGRKITRLPVSHAFHSPRMATMLPEFRKVAESISYGSPRIPLVSTLSGRMARSEDLSSPEYWVQHVRQPVRFADGMQCLYSSGVRTFIELGPDGTLAAMGKECLFTETDSAVLTSVLSRGQPEHKTLLTALAWMFVRGSAVDWAPAFANSDTCRIQLPTYAFQRQRYWPTELATKARPTVVRKHSKFPDMVSTEGDFLASLTRLNDDERARILLEWTRDATATVLGQANADAVRIDKTFLEQGFDSRLGVELCAKLSAITRLRLPPGLIFEHPTPISVADHLQTLLSAADEGGKDEPSEPESRPTDSVTAQDCGLSALVRRACRTGNAAMGVDLLMTASRLRPAVETKAGIRKSLASVRLANGGQAVTLICFASFAALSDAMEYARLCAAFAGEHDISVLSPPGFREGEFLPANTGVLVEALAEAVRDEAGKKTCALVGHSSAGWAAHAVANRLEASGAAVGAVVLLDTYLPADVVDPGFLPAVMNAMYVRDGVGDTIDDTRLTAMGGYCRLFADWTPGSLTTPTLFVSANDPLPSSPAEPTGAFARPPWPVPHTSVNVPGDHFTMLEEHADSTAEAIRGWLSQRTLRHAA